MLLVNLALMAGLSVSIHLILAYTQGQVSGLALVKPQMNFRWVKSPAGADMRKMGNIEGQQHDGSL